MTVDCCSMVVVVWLIDLWGCCCCCRKEALIAVQESIRIAQEANDSVCLQHALVYVDKYFFDYPDVIIILIKFTHTRKYRIQFELWKNIQLRNRVHR